MKATGIVRRIDDLGRIVIPKEVRKICRLREGDPMEIFVNNDGQILLKKYSPLQNLAEFASDYVESLYEATGHTAMISDKDNIIAVSRGVTRRNFLNQPVWSDVEEVLENNERVKVDAKLTEAKRTLGNETLFSQAIVPIRVDCETIGTIILCSPVEGVTMDTCEIKLAKTASAFIARQMQAE